MPRLSTSHPQAGRNRSATKHERDTGPLASRHRSVAPLSPEEVILIPPITVHCRCGQGNCKWLAGAAHYPQHPQPAPPPRDPSERLPSLGRGTALFVIQFRQMLPKLVIGHFISVPHCVHHGDVAHGAGAYEPSSLVNAQHHRLAIDDEPLVPVLERGLDDPRIQSA